MGDIPAILGQFFIRKNMGIIFLMIFAKFELRSSDSPMAMKSGGDDFTVNIPSGGW